MTTKKDSLISGGGVPAERAIEAAPSDCGCYVMKDANGKILYIGKSRNLKSRMRQYFNPGSTDTRILIQVMLPQVAEVEFILTASEKEALVLENNLIKKHRPPYNVRIRDDKTYFSILLDMNHPYPYLKLIRRRSREPLGPGKIQFGPYTSARAARSTIALVNRHFKLRDCSDREFETRKRPCLRYQMHRCDAPCVFEVDKEEYAKEVKRVRMLLEGRGELIIPELKEEMQQAAKELDFEKAARIRDLIAAVEKTIEQQHVEFSSTEDIDVFATYREGESGVGIVMKLRRGILVEPAKYTINSRGDDDEEVLSRLIMRHYSVSAPPQIVVLPKSIQSADAYMEWLSDLAKHRVQIRVPMRGKLKDLLVIAMKNARQYFDANRSRLDQSALAAEKLRKLLKLESAPKVVECYDISNLQGGFSVGSMVCFVDGKPEPSKYRRYKIKTVEGQDDFAMLYEVLKRRMKHAIEDDEFPDLIVIDGGKGQLYRAMAAISELSNGRRIPVISIAKERITKGSGRNFTSDSIERKVERIFLPGVKNAKVLKEGTAEFFFLTRIRDEAHRFAIEYHRLLRSKRMLHSILDDIPGIGPKRKRMLLKEFGSLKRLKEASLQEIMQVKGIPNDLAKLVYEFLHPEQSKK